MPEVKVRLLALENAVGLQLPTYATEKSAGMDLSAALEEALELGAGERALIPTGLSIALPEGYEAQIRPRSGLAVKYGITVLNTPGTIDADYRGEVFIALINLGTQPYEISHGLRIAQLVIAPVAHAKIIETSTLKKTARGERGFGSTGQR